MSYEAGSLKKTTSDRALAANALAAVNGTYFNTSTGISRHFLKCNGTVMAATQTNEFSTRATGAFCATGDVVEIKSGVRRRKLLRVEIISKLLCRGL